MVKAQSWMRYVPPLALDTRDLWKLIPESLSATPRNGLKHKSGKRPQQLISNRVKMINTPGTACPSSKGSRQGVVGVRELQSLNFRQMRNIPSLWERLYYEAPAQFSNQRCWVALERLWSVLADPPKGCIYLLGPAPHFLILYRGFQPL